MALQFQIEKMSDEEWAEFLDMHLIIDDLARVLVDAKRQGTETEEQEVNDVDFD